MALDFSTLSPDELLAAESAALTMRALLDAVKTAPHGHGMATVEAVLQDKGFAHLRTLLTAAMTSHAEAQKKSGTCSRPCACGKNASFKRCKPKTILSSVGHVAVDRRYYACRHCKAKQTPWEVWAGVTGPHRVTPHARRMIVLAGSGCSYDEAADKLRELTPLRVSDDVVRGICDKEGIAIGDWVNSGPAVPRQTFMKAKGVVEFSTDGLKLNTVEGWREMRLSVLGKREPVAAATAGQWDDRPLEAPTTRMAICAIAPCAIIGDSWKRLAGALGLGEDQALSVIADGAKWIWSQAAKHFTGKDVQWVVDVYHLMLYLHAAAAELGKDAAEQWVGRRVVDLIDMGGPKFIEHLNATGPPASTTATAAENAPTPEAWKGLLHYLEENRDSLWYGRRLKEGLPIGSGLIEGGCKNILAKRLKLNSARWCVDRAEHMGAIRCLQYSGMWEAYWESQKAAA